MFVLIGSHFPSVASNVCSECEGGTKTFLGRPLLMTLFQPIRATAPLSSTAALLALTLSKANTIEKRQLRRSVKGNDDVVCILQSIPFFSWQIQTHSPAQRASSAVEATTKKFNGEQPRRWRLRIAFRAHSNEEAVVAQKQKRERQARILIPKLGERSLVQKKNASPKTIDESDPLLVNL